MELSYFNLGICILVYIYNLEELGPEDKYRLELAPRRIAIISDHADPALETIGFEEAGGQNVYVRAIGEGLVKFGWKVDMFTRLSGLNQTLIVNHGSDCRTIRLKAGPQTFISRNELVLHLEEYLESFVQFKEVNGLQYDVIHTNYWMSGLLGLWIKRIYPRLKHVHTYHSLGAVKYKWEISFNGRSPGPVSENVSHRLLAEKRILENCDMVVATSKEEKLDMEQMVSKKGKIEVIPCGVHWSNSTMSQTQAKLRLGLPSRAKVVLYVGRFDERKGIEVLVRAIHASNSKNSPNFRLILGGGSLPGGPDDKERQRLQKLVHDLGLNNCTTFAGRLDRRNGSLETYYTAADVVVVPSLYEPFGLVPIEAMSLGTPIIGSSVGGLKATVQDGVNGFLVTPGNVTDFSEKIDKVLMNPELRNRLGAAGRERVWKLFTWDIVTRDLDLLLRKLQRLV